MSPLNREMYASHKWDDANSNNNTMNDGRKTSGIGQDGKCPKETQKEQPMNYPAMQQRSEPNKIFMELG